MIAVADAYAECSRITASQAKNFAYGIKLLDRPRRDAMSAIYALARRIDDIGDGDLPHPEPDVAAVAFAGIREVDEHVGLGVELN